MISAFAFLAAQTDGGSSLGNYTTIIILVVFVGIFYFLLIRPQQKQKRAHNELVSSVRKGNEVMTAGGLFGTVTRVKEDYVMVEIAKKTEVKLLRNSIARVISADEAAQLEAEPEETGEEED